MIWKYPYERDDLEIPIRVWFYCNISLYDYWRWEVSVEARSMPSLTALRLQGTLDGCKSAFFCSQSFALAPKYCSLYP